MTEFIANQTESSFFINSSYFTNSSILIIILNITSQTFETSALSNKTINITSEKELSVDITLGNTITIKSTDTIPLKAQIQQNCSSNSFSAYTYE